MLVGPSGAIAALSSAAPRITGPAEPPAVEAAERLISVNNVEGQLRASSIRRVADLVSRHPDESLSIVRAWMDQDAS
jgi:flagellar M-ring protein FliF